MSDFFDTIAAVSTPPGTGGISIVRMSGSRSVSIAAEVFRPPAGKPPRFAPFRAQHGFVRDPENSMLVDECLMLYMRSPKSYTGEDVVEFHCHGGGISSHRILVLLTERGARIARPGEFTLRAYLNGKKDLNQAEAVDALVKARTVAQHDMALTVMCGGIDRAVGAAIDDLRHAATAAEAAINFPDETDATVSDGLHQQLDDLARRLRSLTESFRRNAVHRAGISAVIAGKPNVGKSSFLNWLVEHDRAIVSAAPGTTRDYIEETIMFEGLLVRIADTAGIRKTADDLERRGIEKSRALVSRADLAFVLFDASAPFDDDDRRVIETLRDSRCAGVFAILNKTDLSERFDRTALPPSFVVCTVSLKTGAGLDRFRTAFAAAVSPLFGAWTTGEVSPVNERQYAGIKTMSDILDEYLAGPPDADRQLFCLREVIAAYDRLTGRVVDPGDAERIFEQFCIGK